MLVVAADIPIIQKQSNFSSHYAYHTSFANSVCVLNKPLLCPAAAVDEVRSGKNECSLMQGLESLRTLRSNNTTSLIGLCVRLLLLHDHQCG